MRDEFRCYNGTEPVGRFENRQALGTECVVTCGPGYRLAATAGSGGSAGNLTCVINANGTAGVWSGAVPACELGTGTFRSQFCACPLLQV